MNTDPNFTTIDILNRIRWQVELDIKYPNGFRAQRDYPYDPEVIYPRAPLVVEMALESVLQDLTDWDGQGKAVLKSLQDKQNELETLVGHVRTASNVVITCLRYDLRLYKLVFCKKGTLEAGQYSRKFQADTIKVVDPYGQTRKGVLAYNDVEALLTADTMYLEFKNPEAQVVLIKTPDGRTLLVRNAVAAAKWDFFVQTGLTPGLREATVVK